MPPRSLPGCPPFGRSPSPLPAGRNRVAGQPAAGGPPRRPRRPRPQPPGG